MATDASVVGRVRLETTRRRALEVRRQRAAEFDDRVREADSWYLQNCREVVDARHAREAAERAAVRQILQRGLVHDPDPRTERQGRMYWLRGLFPADVAGLTAEWGKVDTKLWPVAVQNRVASAALRVLDWHERVHARGRPAEEVTRTWIEWSASHPTGEPRDLSSLNAAGRAHYDRIAHEHEGEQFVEATLQVWYVPTAPAAKPVDVNHLTWREIKHLPATERRMLAWARIGALCDAGSIDPIVKPARQWNEIAEDDEPGKLAWLVEDTWRDALAPCDPAWNGHGPPPLDANRLDPDLAEELLNAVERDLAETGTYVPSRSNGDAAPPPLLITLQRLDDLLGPRLREAAVPFVGTEPFVRGIMEFGMLLSAVPECIAVAQRRDADPQSMAPEAFAYDYMLVLQGGRDILLQLVPPHHRAFVEDRLQKAIDTAWKLVDAFVSRPVSQVVDRPNRRLFHGPWVPLFEEWHQTRNAVLRLISFWQTGKRTEPPQNRRGRTPSAARRSASRRARVGDADALARLDRETPPMNVDDGSWVSSKVAAGLDSVKTRTLATYRNKGDQSSDGRFGRDRDGRVWRRTGTRRSHPWYWKQTLVSERARARGGDEKP